MKPAHRISVLIASFAVFASLACSVNAKDDLERGREAERCEEKILQQNGKPVLKVGLCSELGGYYVLTNLLNTGARACGTLALNNHKPINFCETLKGREVRKSMCPNCGSVIENAALISYALPYADSPFKNYQDLYCMKFAMLSRNQVAGFIKELEETQYPVDDYFQIAGCRQASWGGNVLSPMMHLVADDPAGRVEFPEVIYKYYTIKRKNPDQWLAVVNAKNTEGETVLDYLDHCITIGNFYSEGSKDAVARIISFLCSRGGVYSKYDRKCP